MQASKIIPGLTYAFKRNGELLRFTVREVVTTTRRRGVKANPHDYESEVLGRSQDDSTVTSVAPERILGEYKEHSELVERQKQERLAAERKDRNETNLAVLLTKRLYETVGLPVPEKLDDHDLPFTTRYGRVEINKAGVASLLPALTTQAAIGEVLDNDAFSDANTAWKGN